MRSWWLSLLVLSAVTLDLGLSQSPERNRQDIIRILEAVKRFNTENKGPYFYKPLNDATLGEEKDNSQTWHQDIKETKCRDPKSNLEQCDYRRNGREQSCTIVLAVKGADQITCQNKYRPGGYGLFVKPSRV